MHPPLRVKSDTAAAIMTTSFEGRYSMHLAFRSLLVVNVVVFNLGCDVAGGAFWPCKSVIWCPAIAPWIANWYPILPDDLFPINLTESMGSAVAPDVMRILSG